MGVLNVSPDSFSGDGLSEPAEAADRARRLVAAGADIIDVGGESTRPGSSAISIDEELRRVIPVIERLAGAIPVPLSVDAYKHEVALQALDAGAHMINDIWGLQKGPELAMLAAERGVPIVLMSNQRGRTGSDIMSAVMSDLRRAIERALSSGVPCENIIVDPGIGFGKTVEHNLALLRHLRELTSLGRPVLVGASRKSFIGKLTGVEDPSDRLEGSLAAAVLAVAGGARIVRVHDVWETTRAVAVATAVVQGCAQPVGGDRADRTAAGR